MEPECEVILASEPRRRVFEIIRHKPGVSVSEVARLAGMYWTSAMLHVDGLRAAGVVRSVRVGRRRALFLAPLLDAEAGMSPGILSEPACHHVARIIAEHPDLRVWEVCELATMSERAVYHHVKRLVESGLVASTRPGGYRGLRATPYLHTCLAKTSDEDIVGPDE